MALKIILELGVGRVLRKPPGAQGALTRAVGDGDSSRRH